MDPHSKSSRKSVARAGSRSVAGGDHVVLVLDDDPAVLRSLGRLLAAHGYEVKVFSEPAELFGAGRPAVPACLILDNQLGDGATGVEVHAELLHRGWDLPTVFVTAHWNVQTVVNAIRAGADGFLAKPYDPVELLDAVAQALAHARERFTAVHLTEEMKARAAALSPREREVVALVVGGMLNKEIANRLGLALVTVKVHRGRAMQKLGATNAAELACLATLAEIR